MCDALFATSAVVIDKKMPLCPQYEGSVLHGGCCVVDTDDEELCGLMDEVGNIVLPMECSFICLTNDPE